jgi:hypothetical protein
MIKWDELIEEIGWRTSGMGFAEKALNDFQEKLLRLVRGRAQKHLIEREFEYALALAAEHGSLGMVTRNPEVFARLIFSPGTARNSKFLFTLVASMLKHEALSLWNTSELGFDAIQRPQIEPLAWATEDSEEFGLKEISAASDVEQGALRHVFAASRRTALAAGSTTAYFVNLNVDRCLLVSTSDGTFQSSSFSSLPGLIRLANVYAVKGDEFLFAEALVHEALHCFLYKLEFVNGGFLTRFEEENLPVTSPWSGATIRLQSFLHALFIWYSVAQFWSRRESRLINGARAEQRARFAETAFRNGDAVKIFHQIRGKVRDWAIPGFEALLSCSHTQPIL